MPLLLLPPPSLLSPLFPVLGAAQKDLLNEDKREELWKVLEMARGGWHDLLWCMKQQQQQWWHTGVLHVHCSCAAVYWTPNQPQGVLNSLMVQLGTPVSNGDTDCCIALTSPRPAAISTHTPHPELTQCAACLTPQHTTEEVRKERAKETKHDTTIELAALLHEVRQQQQQQQWQLTPAVEAVIRSPQT